MTEKTNDDLLTAYYDSVIAAYSASNGDYRVSRAVEDAARAAVLARMTEPYSWSYRGMPWSDDLENTAKKVYAGFSHLPGYVPWVEGGNSDKQNEARDFVRGVSVQLAEDAAYEQESYS